MPSWWRGGAHWEYDWRTKSRDRLTDPAWGWPWHRGLDRRNLAVLRTGEAAYMQFGDGSWLGFDLEADPSWGTALGDFAQLHSLAGTCWRGGRNTPSAP